MSCVYTADSSTSTYCLICHCSFVHSLCPQLSFIATCCNQGHQETAYTVEVGNLTAVDALNFTFTEPSEQLYRPIIKPCGYIEMEGSQSILQGLVLQCNNQSRLDENDGYRYNCATSDSTVCSRNVSNAETPICPGGSGMIPIELIVLAYAMYSVLLNIDDFTALFLSVPQLCIQYQVL